MKRELTCIICPRGCSLSVNRGMYPPHPHGNKYSACGKPREHNGKRKNRKPCA